MLSLGELERAAQALEEHLGERRRRHLRVDDRAVERFLAGEVVVERRLGDPDPRGDDRGVFGTLARIVLERGAADPDFMRILTFTALEGHELAEPFFAARVRTLRDFIAGYIERRIAEGAFRRVDPALAARAFFGMVFDHLSVRSVFKQDVSQHPIDEVVDTYVSIFLGGMQPREKTDVGR